MLLILTYLLLLSHSVNFYFTLGCNFTNFTRKYISAYVFTHVLVQYY